MVVGVEKENQANEIALPERASQSAPFLWV